MPQITEIHLIAFSNYFFNSDKKNLLRKMNVTLSEVPVYRTHLLVDYTPIDNSFVHSGWFMV